MFLKLKSDHTTSLFNNFQQLPVAIGTTSKLPWAVRSPLITTSTRSGPWPPRQAHLPPPNTRPYAPATPTLQHPRFLPAFRPLYLLFFGVLFILNAWPGWQLLITEALAYTSCCQEDFLPAFALTSPLPHTHTTFFFAILPTNLCPKQLSGSKIFVSNMVTVCLSRSPLMDRGCAVQIVCSVHST